VFLSPHLTGAKREVCFKGLSTEDFWGKTYILRKGSHFFSLGRQP
jgi:hypothetical protein